MIQGRYGLAEMHLAGKRKTYSNESHPYED